MPTCRSMPPEVWAHAREALVFYFSRRHGMANAEDLAQETLTAVWGRQDYEFERDEDFLRVCYGFAGRISLEGYRKVQKHTGGPLDPNLCAHERQTHGLKGAEIPVFLADVCRLGRTELREKEWKLIERAATSDPRGYSDPGSPGDPNTVRVYLHRARKKLAHLAGWPR